MPLRSPTALTMPRDMPHLLRWREDLMQTEPDYELQQRRLIAMVAGVCIALLVCAFAMVVVATQNRVPLEPAQPALAGEARD